MEGEAPLVPGLQPTDVSSKNSKKLTKVPEAKAWQHRPASSESAQHTQTSKPNQTVAPSPSLGMSSILMGKGHISFYPCGGDEREEEGPPPSKGKPQPCSSQCTSHTERLQLARLDILNGVDPSYLSENERSFLDGQSKEQRKRMFSLTERERAALDGASLDEGEMTQLPNLPVSTAAKRMRPYPLSEPVEHPLDVGALLKNTFSRYFRWF
mmetsp:Transcript_120080/g.285264  ORF Transcript_120080/g.285264 Transcript_120080/m.285264 type:complete len:211 (-) Transcript_120080:106-738(-)|eukprot:CAMPEP_0181485694 /NCGR_PEP_ID=MMETSP1110-20121109/46713_1 /TAXON_ID=174948 /ORGANISM="Symbiodinium sp., Strain CCMP421" /LENGTH=210 /DNA_ID=CAMNT_0023611733 /DNA_START=89 /DNA_END=721 /DNA_ORIENTATION=-